MAQSDPILQEIEKSRRRAHSYSCRDRFGLEVPPPGPLGAGETEFADTCAAYDSLGPERQAMLKGLRAEHSLMHSRAVLGFTDFAPEERTALPPVAQPYRVDIAALPNAGAEPDQNRRLAQPLQQRAQHENLDFTTTWPGGTTGSHRHAESRSGAGERRRSAIDERCAGRGQRHRIRRPARARPFACSMTSGWART